MGIEISGVGRWMVKFCGFGLDFGFYVREDELVGLYYWGGIGLFGE